MGKHQTFYDTVDQIISYGVDKGILHLYTSEEAIDGTTIFIDNRPVKNFGSCSYLGLELDVRLKAGASAALEQFGTQFSESRAYVSLGLYKELQTLLEKIFEAPCVITPTTTLGHIANIPVLIDDDDAVILDQQVHNSVQTAVQLVKARGVHTEILRHNRMDLLETRINELRSKHRKIWYMADGIYSMFGDTTPVEEIYSLLSKYAELYFYVDDAHGMSIHGKHGRGFVLSKNLIHPKMALATSLNKAFASGGGLLVYGDKEMARKVGNVGGPLLSSGPMQPSGLGAAIASARIHLSEEIISLQSELQDNIRFTSIMLTKYKLPVISSPNSAIFFVGVSLPKLGHNVVRRMLSAGYYVNLGVFPTVPMRQTGIRFTITRLHTFKEIESMIATLATQLSLAMIEENIKLEEIYKAFKLPLPAVAQLINSVQQLLAESLELKIYHYKTITDVNKDEWDKIFMNKGSFEWEPLKLLEEAFSKNELPEDNWIFDYILIKNLKGDVLIATFLTTALWKDDMLSAKAISENIEVRRSQDKYYLTSRVISTGSLITEGEHLYIDFASKFWKEALNMLIERIYALQEINKANQIVLRDFYNQSQELDDFMIDNGYFKIKMPHSHELDITTWHDKNEFYSSLSGNNRSHFRKKILRNSERFKVEIIEATDWKEEIDNWYDLYLNVKLKNLELNTFALPRKFFNLIAVNATWEILQLSILDVTNKEFRPCCVVFSYETTDAYVPMIIGLDYTFNKEYGIYRQALYQLVLQAKKKEKKKVLLGFSATIEKQKFGICPSTAYAYMHSKDTYNLESLSAISLTSTKPQMLTNQL